MFDQHPVCVGESHPVETVAHKFHMFTVNPRFIPDGCSLKVNN